MKINTKTLIKDVSGNPLPTQEGNLTLGVVIGNILFSDESIGKLKGYTLGVKFYQDEEVDIDEADLQAIKKAIEMTKVFQSNLITGQALSIINNIK